jgi:hypothetical protein
MFDSDLKMVNPDSESPENLYLGVACGLLIFDSEETKFQMNSLYPGLDALLWNTFQSMKRHLKENKLLSVELSDQLDSFAQPFSSQ